MARVLNKPINNESSVTFGPLAIPDAIDWVALRLDANTSAAQNIWPDAATVVRTEAEISYDGGTTWHPWCFFEAHGGLIQSEIDGSDVPDRWCRVPVPAGTNRQARGTVDVTDGPSLRSVFRVDFD